MSSFKFNISQEIWDTIFGKEEQIMSNEKFIKDKTDSMKWAEYGWLYNLPQDYCGDVFLGTGDDEIIAELPCDVLNAPNVVPDKMMTNLSSVISQKEFLDYCYRNSWGNIYDNVV